MPTGKPKRWPVGNKPDIRGCMTKGAGSELEIGDLVLVRKTVWKGKHKIQDRWESDEYQVIGQLTSGIPVYKVECVAEGRTRILHRNLLLPLQGKIRQPGGLEVEDLPCPDEEEDEEDGMPGVTRAPQVRARRKDTTPQSSPTQQGRHLGKIP